LLIYINSIEVTPMPAHQHLFRAILITFALICITGCNASVPVKIVLTPLTVTRDTVDLPLVSLTNLFDYWARSSNPNPVPTPGVGWSLNGGFDAGIQYSLGFIFFKALSWTFGSVDYIVGRSVYPAWPWGMSPWKKKDQSFWAVLYPSTRALWGNDPPDTANQADEQKKTAPPNAPQL